MHAQQVRVLTGCKAIDRGTNFSEEVKHSSHESICDARAATCDFVCVPPAVSISSRHKTKSKNVAGPATKRETQREQQCELRMRPTHHTRSRALRTFANCSARAPYACFGDPAACKRLEYSPGWSVARLALLSHLPAPPCRNALDMPMFSSKAKPLGEKIFNAVQKKQAVEALRVRWRLAQRPRASRQTCA